MSDWLPRIRRALWLVIWAAMALAGGVLLFRQYDAAPPPAASDIPFGGHFTLIDRHGQPFTDAKLKGRPFAIFFGYTRCPDVCPTSLNRMAQLRTQLGADGNKFDIVFVSVDPDHDSPQTVGAYVDLFGTPIIGLTGSTAQIAEITKAYHLYVAKVPQADGDFTIDHTAAIFLMGRNGEFVAMIDHQEDQNMALAKLRQLVGA
jgi:protein SCO1/2